MARYPEVSTFIMVDLSNEESRTVYNEMQLWSGALINELDTRDIEMDAAPSTTVLSVVTVTDIGAPIAGNIAFSSGESKFKGYDGTNWQDLH
jgi:hypothetical protein|tara:strand:+ start:268 stop:543 length:276 start_codon:yes stop_codon:yes gene_type:complete